MKFLTPQRKNTNRKFIQQAVVIIESKKTEEVRD